MDAMPVTMEQVLGGWAAQLDKGAQRVVSALSRARLLAIGGTAVGSVSRPFLFFASLESPILSSVQSNGARLSTLLHY